MVEQQATTVPVILGNGARRIFLEIGSAESVDFQLIHLETLQALQRSALVPSIYPMGLHPLLLQFCPGNLCQTTFDSFTEVCVISLLLLFELFLYRIYPKHTVFRSFLYRVLRNVLEIL